MTLLDLGWSDEYLADDDDIETARLARILAVHRSHMKASNGELDLNIYSSHQDIQIGVGDWIQFTPPFVDEQNSQAALVQKLIPRKTKLSRASKGREQIFAANIDNVFVVTSANHDMNIKRLHRYLVMIMDGGARPHVILSKVDLIDDVETFVKSLKSQFTFDLSVLPASSVSDFGFDQILSLMPRGSTSVFVGSSGVGKSTLVNRLLGQDIQLTKEIRENDSKGRHATTSRQAFWIPNRGMIIDTPGVREIQVFGDSDNLHQVFTDLDEVLSQCRYNNCQHKSEPGCAVIAALESGQISSEDWESYQKLLKEMAFTNRKMDKGEAANTKKRWKQIHKDMRQRRKFEDG